LTEQDYILKKFFTIPSIDYSGDKSSAFYFMNLDQIKKILNGTVLDCNEKKIII
jgi:hypothetical protein